MISILRFKIIYFGLSYFSLSPFPLVILFSQHHYINVTGKYMNAIIEYGR